MRHKPLFVVLIGLAMAASAQAQWKWRDAAGNVQYSDRPPPSGTPDKDILSRPPGARNIVVVPVGAAASAAAAAAASAPTRAEQEAAARQKQDLDRDTAKQKEDERRAAEVRRENCGRAQAQLRGLQSGQRITRVNEQGERVYMDDAQRQAEIDRTREIVTSDCR